jgi:hypothetical protein
MADYPVAISGAAMGDVITSFTYGAGSVVGGAVDAVTNAPPGTTRAYKLDLSANDNDAHFGVQSLATHIHEGGETGTNGPNWGGFGFYGDANPTSDTILCYWAASAADANDYCLKWRASDRKLLLQKAGVDWQAGSAVLASAAWHSVKFKVWRVSGYIYMQVWVNGGTSPDIETTTGFATLLPFRWYMGEDLAAGVNRGLILYVKNISYFPQVADPRWPQIARLGVESQGAYNAFTGTYADVDEAIPDGDTSFVYTASPSLLESFNLFSCASQGIPSDAEILGIQIYGWHRQKNLWPLKWDGYALYRSGGINIVVDLLDPGESYRIFNVLLNTAPYWEDWTVTLIDALEVGLFTEAGHGDGWYVSQMCIDVLWRAAPVRRVYGQVF